MHDVEIYEVNLFVWFVGHSHYMEVDEDWDRVGVFSWFFLYKTIKKNNAHIYVKKYCRAELEGPR